MARAGFLLTGLVLLATVGCAKPVASPPDAGAPSAAAVALCPHGVPAELCTRCEPDLIPVFQAQGDWCEEHGVPESQCLQCNPTLTFTARTAGPPSPRLVQPTTRVRLASADTEKDVGIRTRRVASRPLARTLEVVGELDFNQNRLALLSARGEALVQKVMVDVGDNVKAGQSLVALASASVGEGQAQRSAASARVAATRASVERERALVAKGISPRAALEFAEAELAAAQAAHASAGASLGAAGAGGAGSGGRYVLTASFDGTVVGRHATGGRNAAPGEVLVEVADLSTLWARLDIPEADAARVRPGQKVTLLLEGQSGVKREATLSRVDSRVDAATRTVHARVEVPNPDGSLKAGTFLRATVEVAPAREALLVPRESLQRAGGQTLVFVRQEAGLFQPVPVELGAQTGDEVEVVKGLSAGAEVVTTGAFLLKTEILKDSIGAGCCEEGEE